MYQKIICLGDSITCNWYRQSYADFWQNLLREKFPDQQIQVIAQGRNGETAQDGYYRTHEEVILLKPDLVTIMFGHNDIRLNQSPLIFENYLRKIINLIDRQLSCTIWLLTPNIVADQKAQANYLPYLQAIKRTAENKQVKLIDIWSIFAETDLTKIFTYQIKELTYDGRIGQDILHPNDLGQKLIAQKLMEEFLKI